MNCGHLFNGIGGFALAAHWMGWSNSMHCEIDPFCNKVMNKHFPNSYQHEDIRTTDFTIWRGKLDLVTGGFPCQPYSTAGKRKGKDDDRHLWPEMLRAIREISPSWIVGENVRGLTNWNGGLVFDEVQADLEAEGYEVLPFLLPACGINAPHRRDRIWFVAFNTKFATNGRNNTRKSKGDGLDMGGNMLEKAEWQQGSNDIGSSNQYATDDTNTRTEDMRERKDQVLKSSISANTTGIGKREQTNEIDAISNEGRARIEFSCISSGGFATNSDSSQRCEGGLHKEGSSQTTTGHISACDTWYDRPDWQDFPTQSPVCNRNDGLSHGLADITFPRWRRESIKALGNAIVPQVAYQIFKAIEQWQLNQR